MVEIQINRLNDGVVIQVKHINTWITKTYRREHPDWFLNKIAEAILAELLQGFRPYVTRTEVVDEWKHFCGWPPRYYDITVKVLNTGGMKITIEGGSAWRAEWDGGILRTDGCIDEELFADLINKIRSRKFVEID